MGGGALGDRRGEGEAEVLGEGGEPEKFGLSDGDPAGVSRLRPRWAGLTLDRVERRQDPARGDANGRLSITGRQAAKVAGTKEGPVRHFRFPGLAELNSIGGGGGNKTHE